MNWFRRKITFTLCGLVALVSVADIRFAFSQQLRPTAQTFTVHIDDPGEADGSGVVIAKDRTTYYVLTAWHVVDAPGTYTVRTYDDRPHSIESSDIERLPGYDLAVLKFNSYYDYPLASINNRSLVSEQPVSVSGWRNPTRAITKITYQIIPGSLTGYSNPPEEGGYSLILSTSGVFRGMSGGPVVDEDYQVIGIIGQADSVREGLTGLSLGIPITAFLDSQYGQYVEDIQYPGQNECGEGVFCPEEREPAGISNSREIYVPETGEIPRISR